MPLPRGSHNLPVLQLLVFAPRPIDFSLLWPGKTFLTWRSVLKMAPCPPLTTQACPSYQTLADGKAQPQPLTCSTKSALGLLLWDCFQEPSCAFFAYICTRRPATCAGGHVTSYSQQNLNRRRFLLFLPFFSPSPPPEPYLGTLHTRVDRLTGKEPETCMREGNRATWAYMQVIETFAGCGKCTSRPGIRD